MCEPTESFEAWNVFKCFCNAWHSKEGAGRGKEHFAAVMSPCGLCLRSQYRLKEIYFQSFPQQVPRHTPPCRQSPHQVLSTLKILYINPLTCLNRSIKNHVINDFYCSFNQCLRTRDCHELMFPKENRGIDTPQELLIFIMAR